MRFLKTLLSKQTQLGDPELLAVKLPDRVREDKKARDAWATSPDTDHVFYSGWAGLNPDVRVNTSPDSENPPFMLEALVLDFDSPATPEKIKSFADKLDWPVQVIEHTATPGHWRAICKLDEPLRFPTDGPLVKEFLAYFLKGKKVNRIPGFDSGAFVEPNRYYTSSGKFEILDNPPVDSSSILAALVKFLKKTRAMDESMQIPLPKIYEALAAKFGDGFWPEEFVAGTQGPTFWIEDSTSPKSAILHDWGFYTFSDHAPFAVYKWRDLLGASFVADYSENVVADAVRDIWYDGKLYYKLKPGPAFQEFKSDFEMSRHLRCEFRMLDKRDDDGISSMVDRALELIREINSVTSAGSFVYFPPGLIMGEGGQKFLNTCVVEPVAPAEGPVAWGEGFPLLAHFISNLLPDEFERTHLIWELAHFARSAVNKTPGNGHAIQFYGGRGIGKTWFLDIVLRPLFGSISVDAASYLSGQREHTGEIFSAPLWTINDVSLSLSAAQRATFTARLKNTVAEHWHVQHFKFKQPAKVQWLGRVYMTANDDPASIRSMAINLDDTIMDKVCAYHCGSTIPWEGAFPSAAAILIELPYFMRFLVDVEIDAEWHDPRFGVKSYINPLIKKHMDETSSAGNLQIALIDAMQFRRQEKNEDAWVTTLVDLWRELKDLDGAEIYFNSRATFNWFKIDMERLLARRVPWMACTDGETWTLTYGLLPKQR